jgi:cyclic 2,3-diphosphoglycerate synthetase
VSPVLGRRVAFLTTAPPVAHEAIERHLREELGAEVVLVSGNLARPDALAEDLARAREAELYLVEIKAAAIDVVAEDAHERGVEVVFADNELVPVGVLDLDTELIRLADQAIAREAVTS